MLSVLFNMLLWVSMQAFGCLHYSGLVCLIFFICILFGRPLFNMFWSVVISAMLPYSGPDESFE